MSGLPPNVLQSTGDNSQSNPAQAQHRDTVYCHECQNEWYRDQHGLTCPACNSDFTEILESNLSDPRHLESEDSDEEDEFGGNIMDMGGGGGGGFLSAHPELRSGGPVFIATGPAGGATGPSIVISSTRTISDGNGPPRTETRSYRSGGTPAPGQDPRQPPAGPTNPNNIISSILQTMLGGVNSDQPHQNPPNNQSSSTQQQSQDNSSFGSTGFPTLGSTGSSANPQNQGGPGRPNVIFNATFGSVPITGSHIHIHNDPHAVHQDTHARAHTAHTLGQGPPGQADLGQILAQLFGGGEGGFQPLFQAFGVPRGSTGDYAWSQQEMDRIISQLMEQHQGNRPPPASEDTINSLPKLKIGDKEIAEDTECVVCRDKFEKDEEAVILPCKHLYHFECVKRWLETNDSCPICRTPVTPESERQQQQQQQQPQQQQSQASPFSVLGSIFGGSGQFQNNSQNQGPSQNRDDSSGQPPR